LPQNTNPYRGSHEPHPGKSVYVDGSGGETAAPIHIDGFSRVRLVAAPVGICVLRQFRIAVVAAAGYT
jgi:hypothetical protein